MALSNWDVAAIAFRVRERVRRPDDPACSAEARVAEAKVEAFIEAAQPNLAQVMNDRQQMAPYYEMSRQATELRTVREIETFHDNGVYVDEASGWSVEIYKNWLYVGQAGTRFTVNAGDLDIGGYGGLHVEAVRGPQDGVYVAVFTTSHETIDDQLWTVYSGMLGCGVYGYIDLPEGTSEDGFDYEFVGVQPESIAWMGQWLADSGPRALAAIDLTQAQRFNQGDQYLAGELGIGTPTSAPGGADDTIMSDIVRGMKASHDRQMDDDLESDSDQ